MTKLIGSFGRAVEEIEGEELEFEFFGEKFPLPNRMSIMPFMKASSMDQRGLDSGTPEGLAALYDLVRNSLPPDETRAPTEAEIAMGIPPEHRIVLKSDWERFQECAIRN